MLVLIPMNSEDVQEATITSVNDAKTWAQLRIEEGALVEVVHHEKFDGFEEWSQAVVVNNDAEEVIEFEGMGMVVLVAHTQRLIDDIVEAYLFRELHELA